MDMIICVFFPPFFFGSWIYELNLMVIFTLGYLSLQVQSTDCLILMSFVWWNSNWRIGHQGFYKTRIPNHSSCKISFFVYILLSDSMLLMYIYRFWNALWRLLSNLGLVHSVECYFNKSPFNMKIHFVKRMGHWWGLFRKFLNKKRLWQVKRWAYSRVWEQRGHHLDVPFKLPMFPIIK